MTKPTATTDYAGIFFNDADGKVSGNLLANDVAAPGDSLFLRFLDGARVDAKGAETEIKGDYGTFFVKVDGSYTYVLDKNNPDVLALKGDQTLTEKVSYKIINNKGETDFDYLKLTVHAGSNHKPVANDDFVATAGTLTAKGNVLANDVDPDHGALMVSRAGGENTATVNPNDYSLKFVENSGITTVQGTYGTLDIDRAGNFTYHVDTTLQAYSDLHGAQAVDNFQYRIYDDAFGNAPNSNTTDVAILHISINDVAAV